MFFDAFFYILNNKFSCFIIIIAVFPLHFKQNVCILYVLCNTCLKDLLKDLFIVLLFFSNSNAISTNPNLISSRADFLVSFLVVSSADFIMLLYISIIYLLTLTFGSSRLILINTQPFFSFSFSSLFVLLSVSLSQWPYSLTASLYLRK